MVCLFGKKIQRKIVESFEFVWMKSMCVRVTNNNIIFYMECFTFLGTAEQKHIYPNTNHLLIYTCLLGYEI